MAEKEFQWTPLFARSYKKLDADIKEQVNEALRELAAGALSSGRKEKLRKPKKKGIWQIRINRDHRLTYQKDGNLIILANVGSHDEIERRDC